MENVRLLLSLGVWHKVVVGIRSLIRLGVFTTAFGVLLVVINNLFDYLLYPAVLCSLGFGWGVSSLALISVPFNQILVTGFNWIGREVVMFAWLWQLLGMLLSVARNLFFAILVVSARDATQVFTIICFIAMIIGVPILIVKSLIRFFVSKALLLWGWAGNHIKFITFLGLSAYDPIPAMLFAQKAYGVRLGSFTYASLFITATLVANAFWAVGVVAGIEIIQALDQEVLSFVTWSEEWTTWAISFFGSSWQPDFGFFREILGTCKI